MFFSATMTGHRAPSGARAISRRERWSAALAAASITVGMWATTAFHETAIDNYVLLASAFSHGHLWVDPPPPYIDAFQYHGRWWIVEAPLPALLLMPIVAVTARPGVQSYLGLIFFASILFQTYLLCRARLGANYAVAGLTGVLAAFGTSAWFCAATGDAWYIAHLGAFAFSMAAMSEALGSSRGGLVAGFAVAAGLCRLPLMPAVPFYLLLMKRRRRHDVFAFLIVVAAFAGLYALYDLGRWGTPLERAYVLWFQIKDVRSQAGGAAFALQHVPAQLRAFFVTPPRELSSFPWLISSRFGVALTFASPWLVYGLLEFRLGRSIVLVLMTTVTALPSFLYYDTGGAQVGNRHALDFIPFLVPVFALATRRLGIAAVAPLSLWSLYLNLTSVAVWMSDSGRVPP